MTYLNSQSRLKNNRKQLVDMDHYYHVKKIDTIKIHGLSNWMLHSRDVWHDILSYFCDGLS